MSKKIMRLVALVIVFALCVSSFMACGTSFKVDFYDADKIVKTIKVKEGGVLENKWVPAKDGYDFVDFFVTPTKNHRFDFAKPITKDVAVYIGFAKKQADTREFAIVGSGISKLLISSDWGKVIKPEHKLKKADGKNEYTITCDIMEKDAFQFAINTAWNHKRGYGYLLTNKDASGAECFTASGGLGDVTSKGMNIECVKAGNYTFTLKTYPAEDYYDKNNAGYSEAAKEIYNIGTYDSISWVRNGDILEKPVVTTDFYIKGAKITSWKDVYSAQTKMTNKDDVYSLKIYLAKGDEFMFTSRNTIGSTVSTGTDYLRFTNLDEASKKLFTATKSQNIIANAVGTYTFSYDKKSKVLKATLDEKELPVKADYYIDGTFAEGVKDWADYCFKSNFKLKEGTAGVYEIKNVKMKEGSQIIVQSFKAGATARGEWGKPSYTGLGSFNFSNLVDGGASFSAVDGKNLNIKVLKAGTYNITLDSYSGIVRITAVA